MESFLKFFFKATHDTNTKEFPELLHAIHASGNHYAVSDDLIR